MALKGLGAEADSPEMPRVGVNAAHLLISQCQPKEQANDLVHLRATGWRAPSSCSTSVLLYPGPPSLCFYLFPGG